MHNIFITQLFDWKPHEQSPRVKFVNSVLKWLGYRSLLCTPGPPGMTSVEQRINMYHLVSQVLVYGVPGDLVELGCYSGYSAALFQKIIEHYDPTRTLHVYDSFEGLPESTAEDGNTRFYKGFLAVSQQSVLDSFAEVNAKPPVVHPGWFDKTLPTGLPDKIAFAHLDGDFYDSILVSLEHVYPRLSKGAVCLVDDYCDPEIYNTRNELPGVKRACDDFLKDKPERISVLYAKDAPHGFFRKA